MSLLVAATRNLTSGGRHLTNMERTRLGVLVMWILLLLHLQMQLQTKTRRSKYLYYWAGKKVDFLALP